MNEAEREAARREFDMPRPFIPPAIQATAWSHLGWHEVFVEDSDVQPIKNAYRRFERLNGSRYHYIELPWDSSDLYIAYQIGRLDEVLTQGGLAPWGIREKDA